MTVSLYQPAFSLDFIHTSKAGCKHLFLLYGGIGGAREVFEPEFENTSERCASANLPL